MKTGNLICNYLILAHANFEVLDKLIAALDGANVNFYVHVDRKVKHSYACTKPNVRLIEDRYVVHWAGFGMVNATLALLKSAFKTSSGTGARYILLSGADYPIRPQEMLETYFKAPYEYIDLAPAPLVHKPMSRFELHHFNYDRRNLNNPKSLLLKIAEKVLHKLPFKRSLPFKLFVGSQWFALTDSCVLHILQEVERNPSYIHFFKNSLVPDEAFFQTIIGNSPFAENIQPNLVFTDWTTVPAPATITEKHLELFCNTTTFPYESGTYTPLFARKFDNSNHHLLEQIDATLRTGVGLDR